MTGFTGCEGELPVGKPVPYEVIVEGKDSMNGKRYSLSISGEAELEEEGATLFDCLEALVEHARTEAARMKHPFGIQIRLCVSKEGLSAK